MNDLCNLCISRDTCQEPCLDWYIIEEEINLQEEELRDE